MSFTKQIIDGVELNVSDSIFQCKIIHIDSNITFFDFNKGITYTISDAYGSVDFLEIIDYINDNSIDKNSIVLRDKEQFLSDALIGNEGNQTIIDFVNTLTFEQIEE